MTDKIEVPEIEYSVLRKFADDKRCSFTELCDAVREAVEAPLRLRAALREAAQQAAIDGVAPADRRVCVYDLTPASDVESALHKKLIEMGWKPPAPADERDALAAAMSQAPAVGEEIMVNAAHGVFTLPLQPSGLPSGPRFVVHVPGPEQPAAVDEGSRSVTRQLLHWGGVPVYVTGTVTTSPGNWSLIDAAPAAPEADLSSDERVAALCDLSYRAGLKAGWNYCADDDQTGFARSMESARGAVAVLAAHRKQGGEQ